MLKLLKWVGSTVFALIVLAIAYYVYLIVSFDTEKNPENHGNVSAELFLGDGDNQPLIVGFGGAEGGNAWASDYWKSQRDDFIAEGYAFLAIGYFGSNGTPKNLDRIAIESVHKAIMDAAGDPNINQHCIALLGGSKGAELSLVLASHFSDIKAVVAVVPGHAVFPALTIAINTSSFSLNGEPLPFVPMPWSATPELIKGDLRGVWLKMLEDQDAVDHAAIEVENINGPLFFVSATKDEFWPSTEMSEVMVRRLQEKNFPHQVKHLAVEGSHAAPLKHFDDIENFLRENFLNDTANNCSRSASE